MAKVKVISLTQPWAQLVVLGAKKIETRSWSTKHRGELYIHAAQGFPRYCRDIVSRAPFRDYLKMLHVELPTGAIIGKVNLVECVASWQLVAGGLSKDEAAFGDYGEGRWGWLMTDPVKFDKPIPAKGALSLWNYEIDLPEMTLSHE